MVNKLVNRFEHIDILPLAVSDKKELLLYDGSGSNGFVTDPSEDLGRVFSSEVIYSLTIDTICNTFENLDMIKIDIG